MGDTRSDDLHAAHFAAALNHHMGERKMDSITLAKILLSKAEEIGEQRNLKSIRRQVDYAKKGTASGVGRKFGEKIAEVFGSTYGDFLVMGEILTKSVEGKEWENAYLGRVSSLLNEPPILKTEPTPEYVPVPTAAATLSAGSGNLVYQDNLTSVKNYFHAAWLLGKCAGGIGKAVIFKVDGRSMSPTIEDGSEVLVDTTTVGPNDWQPNKIYAIRQENEVWIKRLLHSQQPGTIVISSDNKEIDEKTGTPRYEDRYVSAEELHIIGRVIWHSGEL